MGDGTTSAAAPEPTNLPALANTLPQSDLLPVERFDDPRRKQVAEIAASVTIADSNSIATFGAAPQRKLSGFLDQLLQGTKTDDVGVAGELVAELAQNIKAMNLREVKREAEGHGSFLTNLPVIGKQFSAFRRFRAMHQSVTTHLTTIEQRADTHLARLKANNAGLDRLLDATEDNLRELETWVAAGQQALLRMRDEFATTKAQVMATRDPVQLTKLRDMADQINAFETRLVRMHIAFTRGILSIPQIRSAQQAGRIEIQNTLDTVLFDLPDLKSAIVRVATLRQISKAGEATQARRRLTRELQEIGVDALEQAYTSAKATQGDMADDVASLARVTDRMLGIIDRGLEIDRTNRVKRDDAMRAIGDVRQRLIDGLKAHADKSLGDQGLGT